MSLLSRLLGRDDNRGMRDARAAVVQSSRRRNAAVEAELEVIELEERTEEQHHRNHFLELFEIFHGKAQ